MKLAARAKEISPSPTLSIDARAKKMIAAGEKVINFGAGEPDFDTPEHIKQAAVEALHKGMTKYTPVGGTPALKEAIVRKLKADNNLDYAPEQIVVSCGAKHSLYNAIQALCDPGDEIILPAPYWVSYLEQIKLAGGRPVIVQTRAENGFKLTVEELEAVVSPRTRMIILNSPGNPTGAVYTREELAALGEVLLQKKVTIISDEIYEKLIYDGLEHVSIASLNPGLKELTVVINGVSKAYSMTGWRIGYAAAPAPAAKAMTDLQSHSTSNPTSIAQAASVAALTGTQEPLRQMVAEFNRRRDYMLERLSAIPGVSCFKPSGAFYLFPSIAGIIGRAYKGKTIGSASDLAAILLTEAKVAVVPGVAFGDDRCFRLSYATSLENIKEGLDRIGEVLTSVK
ncbi:MAG: pyridoxal phosphate-dependent aminotransferase [Armatimonadetes bacterium]|nr:pyridoxal phosphate-dependent aminotransferase [Armatimonadota bacterium]